MSFITRPLLGWCLSRYWLYVLNRILGCFITVAIILNISDLSDEQISNFIVWGTFILYALVKISETTPKGQEYLKLWYEEGQKKMIKNISVIKICEENRGGNLCLSPVG